MKNIVVGAIIQAQRNLVPVVTDPETQSGGCLAVPPRLRIKEEDFLAIPAITVIKFALILARHSLLIEIAVAPALNIERLILFRYQILSSNKCIAANDFVETDYLSPVLPGL
jgi:hypothetical protein